MKHFTLAVLAAITLASPTLADKYNRVVTIINDTDVEMREFYASNQDAKTWEEDILGQDVIPGHHQIDININDNSGYCMYDIKAVFSDGDEVIDKLNVCEVGSWRVH
jgi:hypothetical protein